MNSQKCDSRLPLFFNPLEVLREEKYRNITSRLGKHHGYIVSTVSYGRGVLISTDL